MLNTYISGTIPIKTALAATGGQMTLYFHREPSDTNESYNSMGFTPPEPSADTASTTASTTNLNATPPTSFCESTDNTGETFNQVGASSATTGNICIATFISPPVGQAITVSTSDASAVSGVIWDSKSSNASATAVNVFVYRWNGSGTTVNAADRIASFTGANPGTTPTQSSFTAVSPANNISFVATDRIVTIVSENVTTAKPNSSVSVYFDSNARAASDITLEYTATTPSTPSLTGTYDDAFTSGAATTACSTSGVAFNTKWTCLQGSAASTAGELNDGDTTGTTGDSSGWMWIRNKTTATSAVTSNFGTTPSNTFLYQSLPVAYSDGTVQTVVNASQLYASATSPYNHVGIVLWTSNSDYLEVQLYSTAAKGAINTVSVALNNSGVLSGSTGINSSVSNGLYNRIWLGFQNTAGSYQAQYSTDGTTWTNIGSIVSHTSFTRVGLNSYTDIANPVMQYAGAFNWFQYTFAGVLSLSSQASSTLSSVTLSASPGASSGSLGSTIVTDTRGTNAGWTLTAISTNFTVSTNVIAVTNFTMDPSNSSLSVLSGSGTGVTAGASHTFTSTADSMTILSASSGNGNGQYSINPGLSLTVPVGTYVGTYSATITETLQ